MRRAIQPAPRTLAKYGLTLQDWEGMLEQQGGVCGVCGDLPANCRLVIDHEHTPGWKKLPPAERREYVRGLCCTSCNHYVLTRYGSIAKHLGAATYLARYEGRRSERS